VYQGEDESIVVTGLDAGATYSFTLCVKGKENAQGDRSPAFCMSRCPREMRTQGRGNLLDNPSFEISGEQFFARGALDPKYINLPVDHFPAAWHSMMSPISRCQGIARTGNHSLCFHAPDVVNYKFGAAQFVLLNQTEIEGRSRFISFSAWRRARDLSGTPSCSVSLLINYADGTHSQNHRISWYDVDSDWMHACMVVETEKPVRSVLVFVLFLEQTGTVWFDDLWLSTSASVTEADERAGPGCTIERTTYTTQHGCCPERYSILAHSTPEVTALHNCD
jgi:hypothetical protein